MIQVNISEDGSLNIDMAKNVNDTIYNWTIRVYRSESEKPIFIEEDEVTIDYEEE